MKEIVAKMKEKNMRFTWIVPLDYSYKIRYGKNMFMMFYYFFFDFLGIMSNKYGVRVTVAFGKNLTTNIAFYQPKSWSDERITSPVIPLPLPNGGYCTSIFNLNLENETWYSDFSHISSRNINVDALVLG